MNPKSKMGIKVGGSKFDLARPSVLQFNIERLAVIRDATTGYLQRYKEHEERLKKETDPAQVDFLMDQMVDSLNLITRSTESLVRRVRVWIDNSDDPATKALKEWLSDKSVEDRETHLIEVFNQAMVHLLGGGETVKNS